MRSATLLTPELDSALDTQDKLDLSTGMEKSYQELSYSLYKFFTPSWDPLKMLESDASLAFVEAAAKNDLPRLKRLLKLSSVTSDVKYYGFVAATQGGHNEAINFFLSLPDLEEIITNEISYISLPAEKKIQSINFKDPQELLGLEERQRQNKLYYFGHGFTGRLGFNAKPNILIVAACAGRLDVITHLQRFNTVNSMLIKSYGYYVCLRAAEEGHVHVLNEMLKMTTVYEDVISRDEILLYAAMQGHVNVVDRLLELPIQASLNLLKSALQHGTVKVAERLLKVAEIDKSLSYSGKENRALISAIKQCAIYACYTDRKKTEETASRMFQLLLKYPVVAEVAKEHENANTHDHPVWHILQYMNSSSISDDHHRQMSPRK